MGRSIRRNGKTTPNRAFGAVLIASIFILQTQTTALAAETRSVSVAHDSVPSVQTGASAGSHTLFLPIVVGVGTAAPPPAQPTQRIYWGALVDGQAPSPEKIGIFDAFEQQSGKKMSILHWGQPWKMNGQFVAFQDQYMDTVRNRGEIPMLDWGSTEAGSGINQPEFRLSNIAAGNFDSYIQQWAVAAKHWGHPFFLRFDWEMNGNWQFPWAEQLNGNQPGDYVKAWRHVHDLFHQNGVTNVSWVWCPNIAGSTTRSMSALYPGDAYVDWTCLDGYNKYNVWLSFNTVFTSSGVNWLQNSYQEIVALAPSKPVMIGETGSLEAGDGGALKGEWFRQAFSAAELTQNFPQVKAVVIFDWDDNSSLLATLPIDSSAASIKAFSETIASDKFAANEFAQLGGTVIQPLP